LLPLYSENLCSQESKNLIRKHLKTCETCQQLLKKIPISEIKPEIIPEEKKAFLKINRKLKISILRTACLTLLSSGLLIGIGYLSYGQVAKNPDFQSFETIWQNIEAKKFAKSIATGDFDSYLKAVSVSTDFYLDIPNYQNAFYEKAKEDFETTYQNAFGNTSLKSIKIETCYSSVSIPTENIPVSVVTITYEDKQECMLELIRNLDGKFVVNLRYIYSAYEPETNETIAFQNCMHYISYPEIDPSGYTESMLTLMGLNKDDEQNQRLQIHSQMATYDFAPEYRDNLAQSFMKFYQQGYSINECYFSELIYDQEKKIFYQNATITSKDSQGTAILMTKIYSDYNGLIPPSQDMGKVYQDNCTEQLAENLLKLFG
ncbi:MAG: hypothetical protein K2J88_06535, partial [Oscillospiraceae bacterium]|nr:hypothetical protein [Oscillospiraceae bacterium]